MEVCATRWHEVADNMYLFQGAGGIEVGCVVSGELTYMS